MSIADELEKLKKIKDDGTINEKEFELAKEKLLKNDSKSSLGKAVNRYVIFSIIAFIVTVLMGKIKQTGKNPHRKL